MNENQIGRLVAEALRDAIEPLHEQLNEMSSKLAEVETQIRSAETRSRTIADLKRIAGVRVDGDMTAIGGHHAG